ncbi:hypothetical protein evm_013991 [Chilo suppressalis]|nr:hypothetical protein evm_013991 [Chilo suppressalis]
MVINNQAKTLSWLHHKFGYVIARTNTGDHFTATGPAAETLSTLEDKIIEVVGSATIYDFTSQEFPQLDTQTAEPSSTPQPQLSTSQNRPPITVAQRRPRKRVPRGKNIRASETLIKAMENNNTSFRQGMLTAAETLASAIRDAANILADQIWQSTLQRTMPTPRTKLRHRYIYTKQIILFMCITDCTDF